ncbi:restriction endonuclease subunit S [Rhodanobacter ginsenosidimutans]|uniref:Restriction endonuclease subunit S n=1 Tax=Rhodanobacter ginsenosidimutans TaxID=490571 RepID=A0ABW0JW70_9GAMM
MSKSQVAERSVVYALKTAVEPAFNDSFDLLATAPKGVVKLRELILVLAVRGKLSSQECGDEPIDALLAAIATQVAPGAGRREKRKHETVVDEGPYSIPARWKWVRLGELGKVLGGGTPRSDDPSLWASGNGVPWLTPADLYGLRDKMIGRGRRDISDAGLRKSSAQLLPRGSVLFSSRAPIGYVAIAAIPLATNQGFKSCVPHVHGLADYLYWFLKYAGKGIDAAASGTTFKEISGAEFSKVLVPLPPLAEQARIVARVEELMQLCDALEAHGRLQDEQHARLVATLFDALAASASAEELAENWQRIATHFDLLLDRPEAVDTLEKTLLQLAVRGLLVPQDPTDEPASQLLNRIANEKRRLVDLGKIKQERLPPAANRGSPAFGLPSEWEWAKLGQIATLVTDGAHHTPQYLPDGVPFLSVKNLSTGCLDFSVTRFISELAHADLIKRCNPELGDLLLTKIGTTGIAVVIDDPRPFSIFVSVALIKLPSELMDRDYLCLVINSPFVRKQSEDGTEGVGNKNLVLRKIKAFDIPLPPLAEQHRIVIRVEQLRRLCADLREHLQQARTTQSRLADALVSAAAQSSSC